MGTVDEAREVELLEEMFKDRFTDNDAVYMEIKSKSLSQPTVIYPWRFKKQWNKTWDHHSSERRDHDHNRHRYNDRDRNHHRENSHSRYRDRSRDGESSRYRDDHHDQRNSYRRREDRQ